MKEVNTAKSAKHIADMMDTLMLLKNDSRDLLELSDEEYTAYFEEAMEAMRESE